jgi:hypothetical protein
MREEEHEINCKDAEDATLWITETIESATAYIIGLFIRAALLNVSLTWFGILPSAGNNMVLSLSNVIFIMFILYAIK